MNVDANSANLPVIPPGKESADAERASTDSAGSHPQEMGKGLRDGKVMDAAKVEEIKQAIAEGRFQVNTGVVADQLIESALDLISSRRP